MILQKLLLPVNLFAELFGIWISSGSGAHRLCGVWIHTNFMSLHEASAPSFSNSSGNIAVFSKPQLERVCRDSKHEKFSENFQLQLYFSSPAAMQKQLPIETPAPPNAFIPPGLVTRNILAVRPIATTCTQAILQRQGGSILWKISNY